MSEPTLDDVRDYAGKAWQLFTRERNLNASLDWADTPDGGDERMVSARVCGQGAAYALQRFTADYHVALGAPGDQRPQFDYTDPARVACVWRKSGVWIELWVSTEQAMERKPAPPPRVFQAATSEPVVSAPADNRSPFSRASGRLPFTRRTRKAPAA